MLKTEIHLHLITKISATTYKTKDASSNQSSAPKPIAVMRFEVNRKATATTVSIVKTMPVPIIAGPCIVRPWMVSIAARRRNKHQC